MSHQTNNHQKNIEASMRTVRKDKISTKISLTNMMFIPKDCSPAYDGVKIRRCNLKYEWHHPTTSNMACPNEGDMLNGGNVDICGKYLSNDDWGMRDRIHISLPKNIS